MLSDLPDEKSLLFIDLAVPRDIQPETAEVPGVILYNIDSFQAERLDSVQQKEICQAKEVLKVYKKEFYDWYEGREMIPVIDEIKKTIAKDVNLRLTKVMKKAPLEEEERGEITSRIHQAVENTMGKMLFELKDQVGEETYRECIYAIEKIFI